jgi:phage regulator Rha-like protein
MSTMTALTASTTPFLQMSSLEIAELTGKRHADVLRDIRAMLSQVFDLPDNAEMRYEQIQGVTVNYDEHTKRVSVLHLDKELTLTLLTGYNAKARFNVVRRWQELEQGAAPQVLPAATQERAALDIVKSRLEVAELFQVPLHMAQVEAAKAALMHTGVDYAPLLSHAPAQNNIPPENVMLEPADLAARFNITWGTGTPNGAAVNELLRRHGYQEKVCGAWKPTEQGVPYSSQHQWTKGPKSGFNYKWSVPLVEYLLDLEASM